MNNKNLALLLASIITTFFVSSCGNDDHGRSPMASTESSIPAILEDLSPGLKGVDADTNNIRDDIDQLIEEKFSPTPEVKRAAEQDARATQKFMEATTREEGLIAAEQMSRSSFCISKALPDPDGDQDMRLAISMEIEAWTANTKERLSKYLDSNRLVGGAYFTQPAEPVCD